jgi:thymidylate kinase
MNPPDLIDASIGSRVLVFGSLPPHGRDLDLLVREPEEIALGACLAEAGFVRQGNEWARFAECSVDVVELVSAAGWDLPPDELTALFDEGLDIDGLRHLVQPSPHHTLLILARRIACGDGLLDEKRRIRLQAALADDPDAWARAQTLAESWSAAEALNALEDAWRTRERIPAARRAAARRERQGARVERERWGRPRLVSAVKRISRPRRGVVVALSGLDGAGKSSQGAALREVLERLGYDATVVRTRIAWDDSLWTIAGPIKRLLTPPLRVLSGLRHTRTAPARSLARERAQAGDPDGGADEQPATPDPVTKVRESSALLTDIWTLMITLANAASQWRHMRRQLMRGGIVICDRYTLDSIVELRYSYGAERPFRGARAALSLLYPTPVRAFFLDVSPEVALERKGEWGLQWLSEHRDLYRQECERLGVRLLDGEQPQAEICAEVAREVWLSGI